jgi:hypothetical protein
MQAVLYSDVHTLDNLMSQGPIPGVQTYCIYGTVVMSSAHSVHHTTAFMVLLS